MTDDPLPIPIAEQRLPLAPVALELPLGLVDSWSSWLSKQVALHCLCN